MVVYNGNPYFLMDDLGGYHDFWKHPCFSSPGFANTVDLFRNPKQTTLWMYKNLVNNGVNYQPQLS